MTTYLIENCDSNQFPSIIAGIENVIDYLSSKGIIVKKEKPDNIMLRVYTQYHIEKLGQDKYMDIRFHTSSLSIETNCGESRVLLLVHKLTTFSGGELTSQNLNTIDDVAAVPDRK